MPRRGSSKPPAEPVVKPYGCDFLTKNQILLVNNKKMIIIIIRLEYDLN